MELPLRGNKYPGSLVLRVTNTQAISTSGDQV
jgi:hypothetical protein